MTVSDSSEPTGPTSTSDSKTRRRPAKTLPTDRIRFDKQLDILRAWAAASGYDRGPAAAKDVAAIVSMAESTIMQANPFFSDIGLIVRTDKGYVPAPEVTAYWKAHEWDKVNASKKLYPVIINSWFAQAVMPKTKFRPVNEREAIHDLDEVASAGPGKESQLKLLLDFMMAAGAVERDPSGMLRATSSAQEQAPPPSPLAVVETPRPPAGVFEPTGVKQHQLWLLEILNAYPDLDEKDQDAILKLIKTIKKGGREGNENAPHVSE